MSHLEKAFADLGYPLPAPSAPGGNYVPYVVHQGWLYIAGQTPIVDGRVAYTGKLGTEVDVETGQAAARVCVLNVMAQAKAAAGGLENIARIIKLTGFVASAPDFTQQPLVINGASDLLGQAMGDIGRHARSAVGVAALPFDSSVEIEAIMALKA